MQSNQHWTRLVRIILAASAVLHLAGAAGADAASDRIPPCHDLATVILNSTIRRPGIVGAECYQTDVPVGGLLLLDVSVQDPTMAEARVDFFGSRCGERNTIDAQHRYVDTAASSLLLWVDGPGTQVYCVAAQDPRKQLGAYKLHVAFSAVPTVKGGDPTEREPDPDPQAGLVGKSMLDLCLIEAEDANSDVRLCATPIGERSAIEGVLANAWRDDEDYWIFSVDRLPHATVDIDIMSDSGEIHGEIQDVHGHVLAQTEYDIREGRHRLSITLAGTGSYFLRIYGAGNQVEGRYRVVLEAR